jgi:branched-chain amino acid aminotransferase
VLGVTKSQSAKLFVVLTTVGPYFPTGFKPVNLFCDDTIARAWPGGVGDKKIGGNYGPTIAHTAKINHLGYQQMLWLIGEI